MFFLLKINAVTYVYRFILANVFTVYSTFLTLLGFVFVFLKNPFKNAWALQLRLVPPACLSDPKYGIHKYIKANNIKLHYVESGDPSKTLMIFLHGYPEFWYSWRYQIVEFSKDYWCVAVDLRGYGDSERLDGVSAYKMELLVEDIRDLIRQLGRDKCILVAHDWGGLIACSLRDEYPDVLNALIMLGSSSKEASINELWNNAEQRKNFWYVFLYRMPVIPEFLLQMHNLVVLDQVMKLHRNDNITESDIECYKYWFGKPYAFTPPLNYYRANFQYTVPEKYIEGNVPMLVANAENDIYFAKSILDRMRLEYKYIETTIVEDCGHFLQQEAPDKINKLIRDFLIKHNLSNSTS